jgi:1,5-anhydro-D-fructose reductase (1,5-anhydro-D-mannitol-forming)
LSVLSKSFKSNGASTKNNLKEQMMKTIRWGIIGCGDVTEIKSGPGFQKARGSELVAVMRRNGNLAEDYARRHRVSKWYDKVEALIYDNDVDAVYIATPPSSHKEYTLAVARAGKPVYVEKPMALNFSECQAMIQACENANVPLFTAFYRRALPRFLKIKLLLDEGQIGTVRGVNLRLYQPPSAEDKKGANQWRVDPNIAGGGYFVDLGSHMIDLLQYLLGPIRAAIGFSSNQGKLYEAEDTVSGSFTFESGAHGVGLWSFSASEDLDSTEIIGSQGKITYATFRELPIVLERGGTVERFNIPHPEHVQQPLIQSVVDELLGVGKSPSTGRTGAMTNWVMDRLLGRT